MLLDDVFGVLIPILMDYPLGVVLSNGKTPRGLSLNPYSNGLPSRGQEQLIKRAFPFVS